MRSLRRVVPNSCRASGAYSANRLRASINFGRTRAKGGGGSSASLPRQIMEGAAERGGGGGRTSADAGAEAGRG